MTLLGDLECLSQKNNRNSVLSSPVFDMWPRTRGGRMRHSSVVCSCDTHTHTHTPHTQKKHFCVTGHLLDQRVRARAAAVEWEEAAGAEPTV